MPKPRPLPIPPTPPDPCAIKHLLSSLFKINPKAPRGKGGNPQEICCKTYPKIVKEAFFAEHRLFSLAAAHAEVVNPPGGEPPTGEPCAGEPHARFGGGRVRVTAPSYPYHHLHDEVIYLV